MLKKLFSHTAIYGLAPQIPRLAGVLSLPVITRYLTDIDFGVFGVITAIAGSIGVLANLGLNVILSNTFYKSPGHFKWGWRQIYGFLMLWNIPYAILLSALLYFFIPPEALHNAIWIIILNVLPIVFFGPTSIIGGLYFQLRQKPFQIAIRSIIFGLLSVVLNIYFIAILKYGYMGWFLSICITTMLSHLSYWWPLNNRLNIKPIFNFKRRYIRNSLKISLPTVPHYYSAYLLDTSDRAVMKILNVGTGDIGKYNAAYTVANVIQKVGMAAGQAIGPMLNQAYKDKDEQTPRRLIFILQTVFLCFTFIISIWLKEVFQILIKNAALAKVYPLGVIIVMAYNYRPMYFGANSQLIFNEKTKVLLKVTFTAGIINVILNFALMKGFGYQIAAYTTFVCLMYMGYAGYFLKEFKKTNKLSYYPLLWLAATIGLTVAAYYIVDLSVWLKSFTSFCTLAFAILLIKKFRK